MRHAAAGQEQGGRSLWLGAAVTLLAVAGICALLGGHLLVGALRLAAGVLAGAGLGAVLLAALGARPSLRGRYLAAGLLALLVAAALTVPAVLGTRLPPLERSAAASIEALGDGESVHSLPLPDAPVLVRRADGSGRLLDAEGARTVEASTHDVLALSQDGEHLVRATGASTEVFALDRAAPAAGGGLPSLTFEGTPLAIAGDVLVMRDCTDGFCSLAGYDLSAGEEPLWVVTGSAETRGIDPAGLSVPARAAEPPGLLDAARESGTLPAVPLHFDPAQGWVQLDPATGFPVGRILAGPEEECRLSATDAPTTAPDPRRPAPEVLTVCSAEDGALTATAFREGEQLWQSDPSPAGSWSVRMDQGRVLAEGTEDGADAAGEILASEHRAAWGAPGGEGVEEAAAFTARIGIDGAAMVVTNEAGQLLGYDTTEGANLWTLPLTAPGTEVRGSLATGTAVVIDEAAREEPLTPRGAHRLRVLDAASGEVAVELRTAEEISAVHPVGGGRALVTVGERTLLLGG